MRLESFTIQANPVHAPAFVLVGERHLIAQRARNYPCVPALPAKRLEILEAGVVKLCSLPDTARSVPAPLRSATFMDCTMRTSPMMRPATATPMRPGMWQALPRSSHSLRPSTRYPAQGSCTNKACSSGFESMRNVGRRAFKF